MLGLGVRVRFSVRVRARFNVRLKVKENSGTTE